MTENFDHEIRLLEELFLLPFPNMLYYLMEQKQRWNIAIDDKHESSLAPQDFNLSICMFVQELAPKASIFTHCKLYKTKILYHFRQKKRRSMHAKLLYCSSKFEKDWQLTSMTNRRSTS